MASFWVAMLDFRVVTFALREMYVDLAQLWWVCHDTQQKSNGFEALETGVRKLQMFVETYFFQVPAR